MFVDGREFEKCLSISSDAVLTPERQYVLVTAVDGDVAVSLPATRLLGEGGVICVERDEQSAHDVVLYPDREDTIRGGKTPFRLTASRPGFFFEVA